MNIIKISTAVIIAILFTLSFSSCYYDNLERLNPTVQCDVSGSITYTANIKAIMDNNCNNCHSGVNASAGIRLDTYTDVKNTGLNGKLYNTIIWASGSSPMPKGVNAKMDDCTISKIKKWIDTNYLE